MFFDNKDGYGQKKHGGPHTGMSSGAPLDAGGFSNAIRRAARIDLTIRKGDEEKYYGAYGVPPGSRFARGIRVARGLYRLRLK